MPMNDAGDIYPTNYNPDPLTLDQIAQAVAEAYAQAGAEAATKALAHWVGASVQASAEAYAQAGADALYAYLQETGALATADRVVVKEVIRDRKGVITAFVERSVPEAALEDYRR